MIVISWTGRQSIAALIGTYLNFWVEGNNYDKVNIYIFVWSQNDPDKSNMPRDGTVHELTSNVSIINTSVSLSQL